MIAILSSLHLCYSFLMALDSQMAHERERETKEEETKAKVVI
jgi:hypothetical protein